MAHNLGSKQRRAMEKRKQAVAIMRDFMSPAPLNHTALYRSPASYLVKLYLGRCMCEIPCVVR